MTTESPEKDVVPKEKAFTDNLSRHANNKAHKIQEEIAKAIQDVIYKHNLDQLNISMNFRYNQYSGLSSHDSRIGRPTPNITITDKKEQQAFVDAVQERELNDFTEALENFSWALQNGGPQ